jgi:hypothetical protein
MLAKKFIWPRSPMDTLNSESQKLKKSQENSTPVVRLSEMPTDVCDKCSYKHLSPTVEGVSYVFDTRMHASQTAARRERRLTTHDRGPRADDTPILYTRPSSCDRVRISAPSVRDTSRRIPPLSSCQSAQPGHRSMNNVRFDGEVL